MKSAYELAMERLQQDEPTAGPSLSDEQKQALTDVDSKYTAKVAEREIFLKDKLMQARRDRDPEAVHQLEEQLRNERLRLEDEREAAKEKIRKGE